MVATSFSDAEDGALQGLRMRTQVIYLRGLRRHMDYGSGIVGLKRRISYRSLAEAAEFRPDARSTDRSDVPSKSAVRAALSELERHGLIVKQAGEALIFFLPLAQWGQSGKNMSNTSATHERTPMSDTMTAVCGNDCVSMSDISATHERTPMSDTHLLSVSNNISSAGARGGARETSRMHPEWSPDRQYLDVHMGMQGMGSLRAGELDEVLGEFRSYWYEQVLQLSDGQWTQRLVQAIKRRRRKGGCDGAGRRLSAVERVRAANEQGRRERGEADAYDEFAGRVD